MGRIYPDLAGAFSRSVGNVVYYLKDGESLPVLRVKLRTLRTLLHSRSKKISSAI